MQEGNGWGVPAGLADSDAHTPPIPFRHGWGIAGNSSILRTGIKLNKNSRVTPPAPYRIAPFDDWFGSLRHWKRCEPSLASPGCLALSDMEIARPRYALTDERCPVLSLVAHLESRGLSTQGNKKVLATRLIENISAG